MRDGLASTVQRYSARWASRLARSNGSPFDPTRESTGNGRQYYHAGQSASRSTSDPTPARQWRPRPHGDHFSHDT